MSNFNLIGHAERTLSSEYNRHVGDSLCGTYQVRSNEEQMHDGRVVKSVGYRTVNPADAMKGLRADDFALENLMAVGAFDSLKDTQLHFGNLENTDILENGAAAAMAAMDSAGPLNNE